MPVAVVETKQGMYKEYTVERDDDSKVSTENLSMSRLTSLLA